MYFFGRGISAFFNQFFKWLFWNKTGQKLLFSILIVVIFFVFIKCGEVAAVEDVEDINYKVSDYYESLTNDFIVRLNVALSNNDTNAQLLINSLIDGNSVYLCYGVENGSGYINARPISKNFLNAIVYNGYQFATSNTVTANDYMAVIDYTLYNSSVAHVLYRFNAMSITRTSFDNNAQVFCLPLQLNNKINYNLSSYLQAYKNGDTDTIIQLLEDIKAEQQATNDALTNTTPTSETDSFVDVDSSAVDDLSSSSVDNVFSTMTTSFANKFTNYDLSTVNSFVWNLKGTTITFYSDTIYKIIKGTFFETLLSMLWYYIFGHYAFVWLSNIIHKIKDGSILDGLEVNEVITKEML